MAFGQYAHLDMHQPVTLTANEIRNNLPAEDKADYEPAETQVISLDKPILLFHKPANDNNKPEPESVPDQAETAEQKFYTNLNPRLKKVLAANSNFPKRKHNPNRTALKTAHAPKPAMAPTKAVSSEPLEKIVKFYREHEATAGPALPNTANRSGNIGILKVVHAAETVIQTTTGPQPMDPSVFHKFLLVAETLKIAAKLVA